MDILLIPFAFMLESPNSFILFKEDFHGNVNSVSGLLYTECIPWFRVNQKHPTL